MTTSSSFSARHSRILECLPCHTTSVRPERPRTSQIRASEAFKSWVFLLPLLEGDTVVREPDGTYSKFGVRRKSRKEASLIRVDDMVSEARLRFARVMDAYPSVAVLFPADLVAVTDFAWLAGMGGLSRLMKRIDSNNFRASFRQERDAFLQALGGRRNMIQYVGGWLERCRQIDSLVDFSG